MKVTYALSPQAKGKIERPYGWLQDRLIRTCVRENITEIHAAQEILRHEVDRYNYHQIHSTTLEVPFNHFKMLYLRRSPCFESSLSNLLSNPQKISSACALNELSMLTDAFLFHNLQITVHNSYPRDMVTIRIYPLNHDLFELRFWCRDTLIDVQRLPPMPWEVCSFNS